ncbi:hypothetical protein PInf_002518 [Phytophthora infestans]|nr:hypothetical protein PInf_002518 [Phytophthora infestans]
MADIENEVEFEEMLQFVLDQWRNVRQRKSVPMSNSEGGDEWQGDEQCVDGDEEDADKQIPVRTFTEDDIQAEFNISSSEGEEAFESSGKVKIRLNPKAKKVGRPQKQKKTTSAGENKGRKWYEAPEAGRKVAGEVTLTALINSLDREQPGLMETQRRLSGVLMKHGEAENKKPKFKILKNPVLIQDPLYILPKKLLDAFHAKRIYYYDPLNQRPYIKAANAVANSLKIGGLTEYDVIPQNNPIQLDGFSCGVYVCWMFIRQVSTGHPVDISVASLTKRRFELFYYMLKGHLLPIHPSGSAEQDDTEEKRPAVAQHEDMQQTHEEEQVEPTQKQEVAQTRV